MSGTQPPPPPSRPASPGAEDRWAAFYLEECERTIGRTLTVTRSARPRRLRTSLAGNSKIDGSFTPASRFTGGEGVPSIGLVGRPMRLGQSLLPAVQELLATAGTDPATLLRTFA